MESTDDALLLRSVAEHSSQVYFSYLPEAGQIVYVSPACAAVFDGIVPADINEALPALLASLHPDDRPYLADCWARVLAGEVLEDVELRRLHPNRALQWLVLMACRSQNAAGQTVVNGTLRDFTRLKENLETANKFQTKKNAVLEILSHDLAAPLVLAQQISDYVREQVAVLQNPKLNELLQVLQTTCQDGVTLIRDFVDQEFLESSRVKLNRERLNVVDRMRLVIERYQKSAETISKVFIYDTPTTPLYADLDENKLQQVINNLISNAIKFTPDGGRIVFRIAPAPGNRVLLSVTDDGIGIPAALQPMLFERFTPARRPGLRGEKTTGLGLSICQRIVELHHGRIWCESTEGQGATFFISIPCSGSIGMAAGVQES